MYLKHFGLNEAPFKITPATGFFFSGANRGEILDALIYAITDSEGIIKITGEVGSGKTMLCRMLLERLPKDVEPVYLANPSLSREEMLYAIADALNLDLEGQRVNVILQTLQNLLEQKFEEGKRVVILVDEAHAMPLDTLEELRLLYNLQVGDHKLLQIMLVGQPELNEKLDQPNMRQLKDRIVHHFIMLPLSKTTIEAYLMFRMRTAGFRGSNIFSAAAIKLIGQASQGWLRRINILADKALLAAFVADEQSIEERHVQQAIRDSGFFPKKEASKTTVLLAGTALSALVLTGSVWYMDSGQPGIGSEIKPPAAAAPAPAETVAIPASAPMAQSSVAETATAPASAVPALASATSAVTVTDAPAAQNQNPPVVTAVAASRTAEVPIPTKVTIVKEAVPPEELLLQKRLDATRKMLASRDKNSASIQLFYTEDDAHHSRMERFLQRAKKLGRLEEIYVLPVRIKGKGAYRVLYGTYPSIDAARTGILHLPSHYQQTYAPTLYLPDSPQTMQ